MKEIKFRAWDKECQEMAEVTNIDFEGNWVVHEPNVPLSERCDLMAFDKVVIMQFTGFHDVNGVEIFEGDVLKCTSKIFTNFGKTDTGKYGETIKRVIWMEDAWGTIVINQELTKEGLKNKGLAVTTKYAEVIGNIYENTELIKGS